MWYLPESTLHYLLAASLARLGEAHGHGKRASASGRHPAGRPEREHQHQSDDPEDSAHPRAADACSDEQLVLLLAWGVRQGVVSLEDARLLLRLHSPDEPGAAVSCREVADELGLGHAAVRQRASRATRRLAAAVAEHVGGGLGELRRAA